MLHHTSAKLTSTSASVHSFASVITTGVEFCLEALSQALDKESLPIARIAGNDDLPALTRRIEDEIIQTEIDMDPVQLFLAQAVSIAVGIAIHSFDEVDRSDIVADAKRRRRKSSLRSPGAPRMPSW